MKLVLLLCLSWIGAVGASGYFFVSAPNVLRFNHDEPVVINTFAAGNNFAVNLWLKIKKRSFSWRFTTVSSEDIPVTTTIKVTEQDLEIGPDGMKPPHVTLYARTSLGTYSRKILLSYDTGYILLQTSKPLYHPNDKVLVRALAMTETLQYARGINVTMDIISPSDLTYARHRKTSDNSKFFEESFTLPPHAEEGLWTIKAFYEGQYQTEARTHFQVTEYVLPTFGVTVQVKEKVITDFTTSVEVKITAKYVYEKPVKGKTILKVSCLDENGDTNSLTYTITRLLEEDGSKVIELNKQDLDNLKAQCGGFPTLNGQRFLATVRVIETATGKEEQAYNKRSIFSQSKYKIHFDRSKRVFRPALSYYLRVSVKLANGDSPDPLKVTSKRVATDNSETILTDQNGNVLFVYTISNTDRSAITFRVNVTDQEADTFTVQPYSGDDQIQIRQTTLQAGEMIIDTILHGFGRTGVMYLFLTRGRFVHHIYEDPSIDPKPIVTDEIKNKVSPEARVVAFFVSKQGRLVADSTKFQVTPKCLGKGLELKPKQPVVSPDDISKLTVTGSPNMAVGLNAMDKALLLLDSENVLRKSKMFKLMKSHDLGCGVGGGTNAENVFRDAGVTVVTNAVLNSGLLERETVACGGHGRKKRSLECDESFAEKCCEAGENFAMKVLLKHEGEEKDIDAQTKCYSRTLEIAFLKKENRNRYSMACLKTHFIKCMEVLLRAIEDKGVVAKSANDESGDYLDALKQLGIDDIPTRKHFRDSWLFKSIELDGDGKSDEINLRFPSSITTWMIQAIGITENQGLCIAEPQNVTAIKPVFIQLDLPFKSSRLEYLDVKVTVFNYKEGLDAEFKLFLTPVEGLCIGVDKVDEKKLIGEFTLGPNEAFTVKVPVLPLTAGQFPIKVSVVGWAGQNPLLDAIEKDLLVVNEGIEERESITVCLDPGVKDENSNCVNDDRVISSYRNGDTQTSTVDLTLPENALIDTGSAYGYATSNEMDFVVRAVIAGNDNLLRKPTGCGEQVIFKLAPSVYIMSYWKNTNQMNAQREQLGNDWIRLGVTNELEYRKPDGSYSAYRDREASTWLTAFVGKVFCQAKKMVDGAVSIQHHVVKTLEWLKGKMNWRGDFRDDKPVTSWARAVNLIGQVKENDPSLSAFVLIALLECDVRTAKTNDMMNKAKTYLEGISESKYKSNSFLLAISTYALALAESRKRDRMKQLLLERSHKDNTRGFEYWGNPNERRPASAQSVETTAYALLALMQYPNGISIVGPVVRWLTHQRSASGTFRSTQDSVIGLQALSEYTIKTFSAEVDLHISLSAPGWVGRTQTLTNENRYLLETIRGIPVKQGEHLMKVVTKGIGSGKLIIDYRYNRKKSPDEKCAFDITDIVVGEVDKDADTDVGLDFDRECNVCGCVDNTNKDDTDILDDSDLEDPDEDKDGLANVRKKREGSVEKEQYCITFSLRSLQGRTHGMSIIDVGLETGMQVVQADLDKLKERGIIDMYEMPGKDKGFFILYLDQISQESVEFKFRLEEQFKVEKTSRQPSSVHVYDYYKPDLECRKFYGTGPASGNPVQYNCADDSMPDTCSCLISQCPDANQIQTMYDWFKEENRKPAKELYDRICVFNKATFAIVAEITGKSKDEDKQIWVARAVVKSLLHKGTDDIRENEDVVLYWRTYCGENVVQEGKQYYLIADDGDVSWSSAGTLLYKYQIMGAVALVEKTDISQLPRKHKDRTQEQNKRRFVQRMMNQFEKLIFAGCKL